MRPTYVPEGRNTANLGNKLDKATNNMCIKYKGVQARMEPGAEIFKVNIVDSDSDNDSEEEDESNPHCHESCVNYKNKCEFPIRCKQRRQHGKECPIKAALGEHRCGFMGVIHQKEYNQMNEK